MNVSFVKAAAACAYGIARGYAGASWLWRLPEWLDYTFQPAVRFLIGLWLWRMAGKEV